MPEMETGLRHHIPLREAPAAADGFDGRRLEFLQHGYSSFDEVLRLYYRQVEKNVRMLAGQHYSVFHPVTGQWLNVADWMPKDEQGFRQRPVVNHLLGWFITTHARATENQPVVTFVPGPDRTDSLLAEALDVIMKAQWHTLGMVDANDQMMAWLIVAGRGHMITRIDPTKGEWIEWVGEDMVPVVDAYDQPVLNPADGQPVSMLAKGVPFSPEGEPLARWRQTAPGAGELVKLGQPHRVREGGIDVRVLSPLQVRGTWGPDPWHKKRRHWVRLYESPEDVYRDYGIECEPTIRGDQLADVGEIERLFFGTGWYGASNAYREAQTSATRGEGFVELTCMWEAPGPYEGMEETPDSPGGRFLCGTPEKIIYDGPRQAPYVHTSPVRTWEFVRLPGRQMGTTPQEAMNPLQENYNAGYARLGEHEALATNPKALIDIASGIQEGQWSNRPGIAYRINRRPNVPAVEFVSPPSLGPDIYKIQEMRRREIDDIGHLLGTEGEIPPFEESGEAIKERRFNSDRFIGPTMRRAVEEYARMMDDWRVSLGVVWTQDTVLRWAGDDNVARTLTIAPEILTSGRVDIRPDLESMLPETRAERQARIDALYDRGLLGGLPGTPEAMKRYWQLSRYPHMGRVARWGGIDRTTAEAELGELLRGAHPTSIPVYPWYDHEVHIVVLKEFMKAPEFRRQSPEIQSALLYHLTAHEVALDEQMMQAALRQQSLGVMGGGVPPGPGGAPGGAPGGVPGPKAPGPGPSPAAPGPPTPPRGGIPGGVMPTAPNVLAPR